MCFSVFSASWRRPVRTTHSHCFDERSVPSYLSVALATSKVTFEYNGRLYSCQLFQDLSGFNHPEDGGTAFLHGTTVRSNTIAATSIDETWKLAFIFIRNCLLYMRVISCNYNWWLSTTSTVHSLSRSKSRISHCSEESKSAARKNFMFIL